MRLTLKMIKTAMDNGFTKKEATCGYGIFVGGDTDVVGAEHIERIDVMGFFPSDAAAARKAKKDGIKIIDDFETDAAYIDTPENRKLVLAHYGK